MKISNSFYIRSWLKNSLMAVGTGFVVGYFSSMIIVIYFPPINALIGAGIGFLIYQYVSYDRLWGSRTGELEYEYRIDIVEKVVRKIVFRKLGILQFIKYFQDHFNAIRTTQKDICLSLLADIKISNNKKSLYCIYYKLSDLEMREDNFEEEKRMLNSAISIKPNDLLANFRLAVCCEMDGSVDDAINHYNLASKDPELVSDSLRKFIFSQVERIKLNGPKNRPPPLGAKYQAW